ncbi:MAG: hypothetical protein ACE5NC_06760 [Anaerolineae bacterium]
MVETLRGWLFPTRGRLLPGARVWSVGLRTVHLAAFGILLGGHVFTVDPERLLPALWLTVLSGVGLIAVEVCGEGLYWLFLGKGIAVMVKLALLLAIPVFWEARVVLLLLVVTVASVSSHMSSRYRHYSLLHRRLIAPGDPLRFGLAALRPETGLRKTD